MSFKIPLEIYTIIKYFDSKTHGELMSHYTNDVDAIRQMLSQSIPQLISSAITITSTFVFMVSKSIELTIVCVLMVFVIMGTSSFVAKNSGKYFVKQQVDLGKLNGYIEEMMEGQKVVKVFCHEEEAKAKQRRQIRALLLEASEEIARKYSKQVFTLSIGDYEE